LVRGGGGGGGGAPTWLGRWGFPRHCLGRLVGGGGRCGELGIRGSTLPLVPCRLLFQAQMYWNFVVTLAALIIQRNVRGGWRFSGYWNYPPEVGQMEMGEVSMHGGKVQERICDIIERSVVAVGALRLYIGGGSCGIPIHFLVMGDLPVGYTGPPSRDPQTLLNAWCAGQHANYSQTQRILQLLDLQHLLALPLPLRTRRGVGVLDWKMQRFLFRRHVQRILFWAERRDKGFDRGFSNDISWLIHEVLFQEPVIPDWYDADRKRARESRGGRRCG
jgi:hypothetical protein